MQDASINKSNEYYYHILSHKVLISSLSSKTNTPALKMLSVSLVTLATVSILTVIDRVIYKHPFLSNTAN